MRMTADPQGAAGRSYSVVAEGEPVTELRFPALGPSTATAIAGQVYRMRRTGVLREQFTLETDAGRTPVASATQRDPLRRAFAVAVGARRLSLRAESPLRSDYLLLEGDQIVGALRPAGPRRRGIEASLPDDLPLEACVFLLWVVLLRWRVRRPTRASAGQ